MMQDGGLKVAGEVWGDAQAALGIIHRQGLGKTRHIQIGLLWVQQVAAEQRIKYGKVLGKVNPADLYTKYLDCATMERHLTKLKHEFARGRATEAPKLNNISVSIDEYNLMGWWRSWEWLDPTEDAIKHQSTKTRRSSRNKMCAGEFNVLHGSVTSLEQPVLQGYKRQVQGSTGSNSAQSRRPWGSTQTLPSEHNRVQYPCLDGHAVIHAWGIARMPRVVSREDRTRLLSEKGSDNKKPLYKSSAEVLTTTTTTGMGSTTSTTTGDGHIIEEAETS